MVLKRWYLTIVSTTRDVGYGVFDGVIIDAFIILYVGKITHLRGLLHEPPSKLQQFSKL